MLESRDVANAIEYLINVTVQDAVQKVRAGQGTASSHVMTGVSSCHAAVMAKMQLERALEKALNQPAKFG